MKKKAGGAKDAGGTLPNLRPLLSRAAQQSTQNNAQPVGTQLPSQWLQPWGRAGASF